MGRMPLAAAQPRLAAEAPTLKRPLERLAVIPGQLPGAFEAILIGCGRDGAVRSVSPLYGSIAKNILTTECVVAEIPEKEPVGMPGGGMPDMT
jgi:hypothetical protein